MNEYFYKNKEGFTLIEVLIAGAIFVLLVTLVGGIFSRTVYLQRRAFSAQDIQENSLYVVETIARDIRVSRICTVLGACTSIPQTSLQIEHPVRGTITYSLDTSRGVITKTEAGTTVDITSSDVNFTRFDFYAYHWAIDSMQPKIVMVVSARNKSNPIVNIDFQTTVISRDVRDEFLN